MIPDFQHLRREEGEEKLHFSHLFQYVSAYHPSEEGLENLRQALISGLHEAKNDRRVVEVSFEGEMFFMCYPGGTISLCLRWKTYRPIDPDQDVDFYFYPDNGDSPVDLSEPCAPREPRVPPPIIPRDVGPKIVEAPPPDPSKMYVPVEKMYELDPIHGPYCFKR